MTLPGWSQTGSAQLSAAASAEGHGVLTLYAAPEYVQPGLSL